MKQWAILVALPPVPAVDNLLLGSTFEDNTQPGDGRSPWYLINPDNWQAGERITVAIPPDEPQKRALLLSRRDVGEFRDQIGCQQWLGRCPQKPGTLSVLRYRARAGEGKGRLCISPCIPVILPKDPIADGEDKWVVSELLSRCVSLPPEENSPANGYWYRPADWVTPTTESKG